MDLNLLVFVATTFLTFAVFQLLWDGQLITYPMFGWIRELDETVFLDVHEDYVSSLGVPTYLPSTLYLISSVLFVFFHPPEIDLVFPIALNVLNVGAVAATAFLAVPVHIRIDNEGEATDEDITKLLRANAVRFGLLAINSVLMLYLLVIALS